MFSKTHTNGMYSNSVAQARGTRVQIPNSFFKAETILRVTGIQKKSSNGLANKLQNVMFSKTHTNGMYSNSVAQARGTRVQIPNSFFKAETILRVTGIQKIIEANDVPRIIVLSIY